MITPELLDFIKKERIKGKTDAEIQSVLVGNGWLASDVEEAYRSMDTVPKDVPQPPGNVEYQPEVMPHGRSAGSKAVLFLAVFLLVAGSASAYFFRDNIKTWPVARNFFPEPELCLTVIVEARNSKTGEVETFGSPCDVPKGWEEVPPQLAPAPETNTNLNTDLNTNERFFVGNWKAAGNDVVSVDFNFIANKTFTLDEYFLNEPEKVYNTSGKWKIEAGEPYSGIDTLVLDFKESYPRRPITPESIEQYKSLGVEFPSDKLARVKVEVSESGVFSFRWLGTLFIKSFDASSGLLIND